MSRLQLSYAGHLSDRVQDLYYRTVVPEQIDLHFIALPPFQAFNRFLKGEFHCGEMSFSTFVIMTAQGKAKNQPLPFVGIPVFPSRTFRHGAIYINRKSGIARPEDLSGRRIGVPEYQMTAAVWTRGMLKDEYGVEPKSIAWTTGGLQDAGRKPLLALTIPGIDIRHEDTRTLNDMLVAGELDAVIAPQPPPAFSAGHPDVRRLFADTVAAEQAYVRKTGLFPVMHVLVLRREIYEQHPWAAVSLYNAFEQAKNNCLERLASEEPPPVSFPWAHQMGQAIIAALGRDFWPYGIEKNRTVVEALCRYTWEQGLVPARVEIADLFAPSVAGLGSYRL
jgi:4,5-dihydroxyphthalate decarboxylase